MKVKTNSKGFNNLNEGRTLTIDKELTGDQKTLEVGKELPKSTKIEKNDKQSLEDFKYVYKDSIYNKCMETYGTCDDKDLLDDIAKELYLSSKNYIPDETKNDGELDVKTESKCIINHHKKVENKLIEDESKYNELSKYKDYYIASAFLDLVSDNLISNEFGNLVLSKMKEYGYKPTENDIKSECSKQNNKLNKECSKQN